MTKRVVASYISEGQALVFSVVSTALQTRSEVAIIIPCYNVEDYVERALNSVFSQTYRSFCIHCVDDGSTDETAKILEKYASRCIRLHQGHAGQAAARNLAIRASASDFVAFLDADDEWLAPKLERQIAALKQDPSLGLVCSLCVAAEDQSRQNSGAGTAPVPAAGRLFEPLVRDCFIFTPTVVVRRECLEDVGLFNESLAVSEDFNLWLRIASRWNVAILPEVLAIRHQQRGSLSLSTSPEVILREGIAALEHVKASCAELSSIEDGALRRALVERNYACASYLLSRGASWASRARLAATLKLQPTHWRAFAKLVLSFLPAIALKSTTSMKRKFIARQSWRSSGLQPKNTFPGRRAPANDQHSKVDTGV